MGGDSVVDIGSVRSTSALSKRWWGPDKVLRQESDDSLFLLGIEGNDLGSVRKT